MVTTPMLQLSVIMVEDSPSPTNDIFSALKRSPLHLYHKPPAVTPPCNCTSDMLTHPEVPRPIPGHQEVFVPMLLLQKSSIVGMTNLAYIPVWEHTTILLEPAVPPSLPYLVHL